MSEKLTEKLIDLFKSYYIFLSVSGLTISLCTFSKSEWPAKLPYV